MENQNTALLLATAFAYVLLIIAYLTGFRIWRMSRLPDWDAGAGKPAPPALQAHMAWGGVAGLFLVLGSLNALSAAGEAGPLPVVVLAATALTVISGVARVYMGGGGRLHLLAALAGLIAFGAGAVALVRQIVDVLS